MDTFPAGPELTLAEHVDQALHHDLWLLARSMPERPEGDDTYFQPPAHDLLPLLAEVLAQCQRISETLKERIPSDLIFQVMLKEKRLGPCGWSDMAKESPEVRRFYQVDLVKDVVRHLYETLRDEGRPQKPIVLPKLSKMRRSS